MLWLQNGLSASAETRAHASSGQSVYPRVDGAEPLHRRLSYDDGGGGGGGTKDGTHLHVDDFKGPDGEHQAVDHFVRLWSKSSWETRETGFIETQ